MLFAIYFQKYCRRSRRCDSNPRRCDCLSQPCSTQPTAPAATQIESDPAPTTMCAIWASKIQFLGPKIGPKFRSFVTFSKRFRWFHSSIISHTHCNNFQKCVEYGLARPNFRAILVAKISPNSGLWSLSQNVFTGFASVMSHMLIASTFRGEYGPQRSNFRANLGPTNRSKFHSLDISSKCFHQFRISLGLHVNVNYV